LLSLSPQKESKLREIRLCQRGGGARGKKKRRGGEPSSSKESKKGDVHPNKTD